jgi:hypothetical protein
MADLTTEEIQKLRVVAGNARQGTATVATSENGRRSWVVVDGMGVAMCDCLDGKQDQANALLIAAAWNNMPALLDMAERCAKAEADLIALRALDGDKGAT